MLLAAKLQKFGGISVMGIVVDFVAKTGNYKSKKGLLASYVLFSYGLFGPVLPMWFMKDAYVANLESRGKDSWIEAGLAGLVLYTP